MRPILTIFIVLSIAAVGGAADIEFRIGIEELSLAPRPDARTEARLAHWDDPMGRLMHQFNQQQSWLICFPNLGLQ